MIFKESLVVAWYVTEILMGFFFKLVGSTWWAWPERKRWNHWCHGTNGSLFSSTSRINLYKLMYSAKLISQNSLDSSWAKGIGILNLIIFTVYKHLSDNFLLNYEEVM